MTERSAHYVKRRLLGKTLNAIDWVLWTLGDCCALLSRFVKRCRSVYRARHRNDIGW